MRYFSLLTLIIGICLLHVTVVVATTPTALHARSYPSNNPPNPGKSLGDHCSTSPECQSQYCEHSKCGVKQGLGSKCYKPQGCVSGNCVNGKCVPQAGSGKNGDKCNMSSQCQDGSFCNHSACDTKRVDGSACYKDNGCTSGTCLKGKCIGRNTLDRGKRCSKSESCKTNYCRRGYCDIKKKHGHRCYKDNGCISGACRKAHDGKLRCQ